MKLALLLADLAPSDFGEVADLEVTGIAYDSRSVQPGDLFFALRGGRSDGGEFVAGAFERGAVAAVGEQGDGRRFVRVPEARRALALASHRFFGDPTAKLRVAGVTGTAGKTTTTFILESMLRAAGRETGLIGTVVYRFAGHERAAPLSTPQSTDLARMMDEMVRAGVDSVGMEVTSHALAQRRAEGCRFAAAAFTNMSREHLDFHADMEDYYQAKRRLFTDFGVGDRAAFNLEDAWALRARTETGRGIGFGLVPGADVTAKNVSFSAAGIRAEIVTPSGSMRIASPLVGHINLMNILCASSLGFLLGLDVESMATGVERVTGVPGRMENVGGRFGRRVIVDYSHKVDSLIRVLAIGRTLGAGRLITVFGCGGDRDQGKRPLMGKAAAEGSDVVVITSDNPRSEDPHAIMERIREGLDGTGSRRFDPTSGQIPEGRGLHAMVEDRSAAIRLAVTSAGPDDTVLICGKGHETYQIVGDTVRHFDDREEAERALREMDRPA